ncbi:hypothetical protein SKAU_G00423940 [Synaphobranchus kaupii]|uniref:Uncharacterized protein n=1 Tax=Synaphobranchus kaupii TaxID=118154 RepID=A0A9Q1E5S9_SYNKA|nr:hypothetical protein SKAU_G00423940 [Synaphobranchus kaupii]
MDEHVSSTTANTEDEFDKLQPELGAEDTEVQENNEALPKNSVDDEDISDLIEGEKDAIKRHIPEEDPTIERFSESPGPEPPAATEPEALPPTDSAVAQSTDDQTQADTEDTISEPEKEELIDEPTTTTEDQILQPEKEDNIVQPETEDTNHKPEAPVEAPVSPEKESPSSESAGPCK